METATKKTNGHSRLTNNSPAAGGAEQFLNEVDHRSRAARRYRDICAALAEHLGGEEHVSEVRRHIARRAAALIVWAENEETKLVMPPENDEPPFDAAIYATAVNSMRRLLLDLGLNPHMKVFAPDLKKYLDAVIEVDDAVFVDATPTVEQEPVRRDSRGRPLKGTAKQAEHAKHMREKAAEKKAAREAEERGLVREAVEAAKAERAARRAAANNDETR